MFNLHIGFGGISGSSRYQVGSVAAAIGTVLDLCGNVSNVRYESVDGILLLYGSLGQYLCAGRYLVSAVVHLAGDLRDVPHYVGKMGPDTLKAF